MSKQLQPLEAVKKEFEDIVKTIDSQFGEGYSSKNPGLVQHILTELGRKEDRNMTKAIHKVE